MRDMLVVAIIAATNLLSNPFIIAVTGLVLLIILIIAFLSLLFRSGGKSRKW